MSDLTRVNNVNSISDKEIKMWSVMLYVSTFSGWVVPFLNLIAPLVIWLLKKDADPYINNQGKNIINFQISFMLYGLILVLGMIPLLFLTDLYVLVVSIFTIIVIALSLLEIVCMVIGAIKAADLKPFKLPLTIHFMK